MGKKICIFIAIFYVFAFDNFSLAQFQEEGNFEKINIKANISFEYFNRTISWDDECKSSLKSYFLTLSPEYKTQGGFSLKPILGYSISNFDSLIFKKLPLSTELEVGGINGFILGGEIQKDFFSIQDFMIGVQSQFIYYIGLEKEWEIPGLAVEGTVKGRPSWMRFFIGPVITYDAFDYFSPYISVNYNKLWGTFSLEESIQELEGKEDKKISGMSKLSIALGGSFELLKSFLIKSEACFMPYKDGIDFGIKVRVLYEF